MGEVVAFKASRTLLSSEEAASRRPPSVAVAFDLDETRPALPVISPKIVRPVRVAFTERKAEAHAYVAEWRAHLGLTQTDVAMRLHRDKVWLSKMEKGFSAQRVSDIVELCKVMGIEFEDIFRDPTEAA